MKIETYLKNKELKKEPEFRKLCVTCLQPGFSCYCSAIKKFDPKIKIVILIHPIEVKRRIATGRMASLCLENSELIQGQDYSENKRVNELLDPQSYCPIVLYPGKKSLDVSLISDLKSTFEIHVNFTSDKEIVLFVIDGTWATAKKTMYQSKNLIPLPQICFTPKQKSQFKVRKQPHEKCLSTIEAIYQTLDLIGPLVGFDIQAQEHQKLLEVFNAMVARQLEFVEEARTIDSPTRYRKPQLMKEL